MTKFMVNRLTIFILFGLLNTSTIFGQAISKNIGMKNSIQSDIVKESRTFIVYHPQDYDTSKKTYPVLYLLDGSEERLSFVSSLIKYYFKDDLIIVAIQNTDRDRDMMPLSVPSYPVTKPGADNFLKFIGSELIPIIEENNRTNGQRILCGQSLSGVFTLYAMLVQPQMFDSYIANSAGWYADMDYFFSPLVDKAFQSPETYKDKIIFIANSEIDKYDPRKELLKSMDNFSKKLQVQLGNRVMYKYEIYSKYGHVPYPAFYDAMKFIIESKQNK